MDRRYHSLGKSQECLVKNYHELQTEYDDLKARNQELASNYDTVFNELVKVTLELQVHQDKKNIDL